jgi:hypothetical protein
VLPGTGARLGAALARVAAATGPGAVGTPDAGGLHAAVAASASVQQLMYDVVFDGPFDPSSPHCSAPRGSPAAAAVARLIHGDAALLAEVAGLAASWRAPDAPQRVLAHTDVWLGNVLVGGPDSGQLSIIDFEFGAWAPAAYDIGHALGQLALGALLVRALAEAEAEDAGAGAGPGAAARAAQEAWLLSEIPAAWEAYASELAALNQQAAAAGRPPLAPPPMEDVLGYAGVVAIRWSTGQFNLFRELGLDRTGAPFSRAVWRGAVAGAALLKGRARSGPRGAAAAAAAALACDPLARRA